MSLNVFLDVWEQCCLAHTLLEWEEEEEEEEEEQYSSNHSETGTVSGSICAVMHTV